MIKKLAALLMLVSFGALAGCNTMEGVGRDVERGSHAQLIARGGVYAELYALQTRPDARDEEQPARETEEAWA